VARCSSLELSAFLRAQIDDLASPAVTDLFQDLGNTLEGLGWCGLSVEELAELLSLLVIVRRVPGDVGGLAVEEV
jgi:hypothetical protein